MLTKLFRISLKIIRLLKQLIVNDRWGNKVKKNIEICYINLHLIFFSKLKIY